MSSRMLRLLILPVTIFVTVSFSTPVKRMSYACTLLIHRDCHTSDQNQVCGTNNVTYYNTCELSQQHCRHESIHFAHYGACVTTSTSSNMTHGQDLVLELVCQSLRICPRIYKPVCASDGFTYGNECEYEMQRCHNRDLHLVSMGACPSS